MRFPAIYLASGSPRRSELLKQIGVDFSKLIADVDETVRAGEQPETYVQRVALEKAQKGWQMVPHNTRRPVLAADTSVVINGAILGKPRDKEDAKSMLEMLSGQTHKVMTATALVYKEHVLSKLNISTVRFMTLSPEEIDWYIATGEGADKAGSYAVQGLAAVFIDQIDGSYSGIMGLPLNDVAQLLKQIGMLLNE